MNILIIAVVLALALWAGIRLHKKKSGCKGCPLSKVCTKRAGL